MKKTFYFILLLATMITLTACSKGINALNGTTWRASYDTDLSFILEFEDDSKVFGFIADDYGTISGCVYYGSYSFSNNDIVFYDFSIPYHYDFYFTNGTVSGNHMTLNYYNVFLETRYDHQMTFRKQ